MTKTLELVLADWREKATSARVLKDSRVAGVIDELCDDVSRAAEDYLRFLAENDARLWSGKSIDWLRARFAEWEATGNARKDHGLRYYRAIVLPRRPDLIAAREAGLRGERPKERAS